MMKLWMVKVSFVGVGVVVRVPGKIESVGVEEGRRDGELGN